MPDVRGEKILLFGDSLSSGQLSPGWFLAQHLGGAKEVRVNARVGRSANNFWAREDAPAQLRQAIGWDPTLVIIELGTNDIGLSMSIDGQKMREIKDALGQNGAEVWAFGPPAFPTGTKQHNGSAEVVQMMRQVFGPRFIDLRPITADLLSSAHRTSDKVHFTAAGAKLAGERMARSFREASDGGGDLGLAAIAAVALYLIFR